ncbi:NAD(P)-dependent alcohol dehydrogenase [Sphingobium sp. CR2-8]|uniref:NAD(P)-dependent alcohol dehydrogenase n=1 Tax=Sphingobium sp. CR2-8 TaxID=1306534 RepID=UPI002DB69641|nr:NAD(P)-dependent alcohol dehydrogenase [Sphingobium sp. CR2-8]MEC3909203.1 NAD(P)-dependent alcohol dehydrogenase [Sphingobium sp. CR2-8]
MERIAIKAAVVESVGTAFEILDLEMDPPGPGQVRVKMVACGICHTDMVMRDGDLPIPFPVILGHEGAGIVEAVGAGVDHVVCGDSVLLSFHSCGQCRSCHAHQPGYCAEFVPRNFQAVLQPGEGGVWQDKRPVNSNIFGQSAFATYALAHRDNVIKVEPTLPLHLLAPLGCSIQTGAGTVLETLHVAAGDAIAILGAGAVGLSAVMAAVIAGASRITVIDRHAHRLSLAQDVGATETGIALDDVTGMFDHIIDTTGSPALVTIAMDKLAQRGTLALVGAYPEDAATFAPAAIMSMGRRIIGVVEGGVDPQSFIPQLVVHYMAGRLPLEKLVETYAFADIEQAVAASAGGAVIKPVVLM